MSSSHDRRTRVVHLGRPRAVGDAVVGTSTPLETSTSFHGAEAELAYRALAGQEHGLAYARLHNPTARALEEALCELEGGQVARCAASGMAALHLAWLSCALRPGDRVVIARDVYGTSEGLMRDLFAPMGIDVVSLDLVDLDADALRRLAPRLVHGEVVSNPLIRVMDLERLSPLCAEIGASLVIDATFTTPCLSRPLSQGADLVVHSLTKYIGGHGDVMGGVVVARDRDRAASLQRWRTLTGGVLSPFDAFLALRGLRTLALRVDQHCRNAQRVAEALEAHALVARVHYPGLPGHPQHARARRLLEGGFGGMLALEFCHQGGRARAMAFLDALELVVASTTLGEVCSLALYPAESSHRGLSDEALRARGISADLVRVSVGIEAAEDIIADIDQALRRTEP